MATIHLANIRPTKAEIVERLLGGPVEMVAAYRFDDPAGKVGVEALIVRHSGQVRQLVFSYRGSPLPGADAHLVATMEHSVLGRRWIYDAAGDPVARNCFRRALVGEQSQAVEEVPAPDGGWQQRRPSATVRLISGSGEAAESGAVVLARDLADSDSDANAGEGPRLRAEWEGGSAVVAWLD